MSKSHRARGGGFMSWKVITSLGCILSAATLFFMTDREMTTEYLAYKASFSVRDFYPSSIAAPSSQTCLVDAAKSNQNSTIARANPPQNSSTATVMAMATGYNLGDYKRFVGSLRKTGYQGHVILAVSPVLEPDVEEYLTSKKVTIKRVSYVNCSHPLLKEEEQNGNHDKELVTCVHPYPSLKHRWARFPLLRDYLKECTTCTGPVLITDMRDTLFQRDPFGPEAPLVPPNTLQVFQEHPMVRTTHWLVDWPVGDCKGVHFDKPMLCSGTTVGTRSAMLEYLRVMHAEMDAWMQDPKCCCFKTNGDDQSIHNYLFYSGKLDHIAVAVPDRMGLVNTVGAQAGQIFDHHINSKRALLAAKGENIDDAWGTKFDVKEDSKGNWLGLHYGMTDEEGYFTNYNGERSFIAHQIDRFGPVYMNWIEANKDRLVE
jgi:hypothetical protein